VLFNGRAGHLNGAAVQLTRHEVQIRQLHLGLVDILGDHLQLRLRGRIGLLSDPGRDGLRETWWLPGRALPRLSKLGQHASALLLQQAVLHFIVRVVLRRHASEQAAWPVHPPVVELAVLDGIAHEPGVALGDDHERVLVDDELLERRALLKSGEHLLILRTGHLPSNVGELALPARHVEGF
jgi:hypothetical protein